MIATAMLAVGCQKEEVNTASQQSNEVTFNLTTEGSMATRANNHPAGLRYTMELYMLNANQSTIDAEYAEPIAEFNSQEAASFSAILEEGIGYTALFWADYDTDDTDGSGGDYNTKDLLKVTINGNPKKEAFSGKVSFTFSSANATFDVTLTHAVAKVQYKQTVDFIADDNTLKVTYPSTYSFSVEDEEITELLTMSESTPVTHTFTGIAQASAGQAIGTSYIFAESGVQTVVDELKFQLNAESEKDLTQVPFQRNHTTNIIGAFSTAYSSTLTAICTDVWETEHNENMPFTSSLANLPSDATGIAADTWIITDSGNLSYDDIANLRTLLNSATGRSISLEFPALTVFVQGMLENTSNLVSVTANSAILIDRGAIVGCDQLISVSFPAADRLGEGALSYNPKLSSVYLPKVVSTNAGVFNGCTSLAKVTIATEQGLTIDRINTLTFGDADLSKITLTTGFGNNTQTDATGKNWIVPDGAGGTNTITGFDAVIGADVK